MRTFAFYRIQSLNFVIVPSTELNAADCSDSGERGRDTREMRGR